MNDRSLSDPDIEWDNVRPTEAVRLLPSDYCRGRQDGIAAVAHWLQTSARYFSHDPKKRDFLLETASVLRDKHELGLL